MISRVQYTGLRFRALNCGRNVTRINALPPQVTLAISQQTIAYGVVLIGENLYSRTALNADDPGRPKVPAMIASIAGYSTTVALLSLENEILQIAGLITGLMTCVYVLSVSVNRITNTKSDPDSWPGPKSWPVFVSLGASSVALAYLQSFPSLNL